MGAINGVWKGGLMLAVAGAAWGGMFPVVKGVMGVLDPFGLTLIRYGVAAPVFLLVLWLAEGRGSLASEGNGWRLWRSGTLGFAGFGLLAFVGLRYARPEHAAVIPALMPLIAILVNWVRLRERPGGWALACVALGLLGVALAVGAAHLPQPRALLGDLPALLYLTLLASVVAVLGWNYGIKAVGAARGVLFINLVPIVAFTIAIASGRPAQPIELAGVGLVLLALVLNSLGSAALTRPMLRLSRT